MLVGFPILTRKITYLLFSAGRLLGSAGLFRCKQFDIKVMF